MEVFLIALVVVSISFIILGLNIFFRKKAFPETEVGKNKTMREMGIFCVKCEENKTYREKMAKAKKKVDYSSLKIDMG